MRRSLVSVALAGVLAIVVPTSGSVQVRADGFGYNGPGYTADGIQHTFCYYDVPADYRPRVRDSMSYLDDRTDVYDVLHSPCRTDPNLLDQTDVLWIHDFQGTDLYGTAPCARMRLWSTSVCDQVWIVIYVAAHYVTASSCGNFDVNMIQSVRHELGHSVGLAHVQPSQGLCGPPNINVTDDAMASDWSPLSYEWLDYNAHHKGHIDLWYD